MSCSAFACTTYNIIGLHPWTVVCTLLSFLYSTNWFLSWVSIAYTCDQWANFAAFTRFNLSAWVDRLDWWVHAESSIMQLRQFNTCTDLWHICKHVIDSAAACWCLDCYNASHDMHSIIAGNERHQMHCMCIVQKLQYVRKSREMHKFFLLS